MINPALFSSERMDWATPQDLFDDLDLEFGFTLDPCTDASNNKCQRYFTKEQNGLAQDWTGERVFCNPPYGRWIGLWVKKCAEHGGLAVMLIPARTDTRWFHEYIYRKPNVEIRFLRGRLKFEGAANAAPFPSMVVIFNGVCNADIHDSHRQDQRP